MLIAQFVDRTGTGVWASSSVLYLTFVVHLDARRVGLLLGTAGVAGIVGSPVAGRLAGRFPLRRLLIGCHLLRLGTLCLLLVSTSFDVVLLPVVAATYVGDGAAKTLEMLFATEAAGERRSTYRALSRSAANAGYALGAGLAAVGLAVGTPDAYRVLILGNALSFLLAAALVACTRERAVGGRMVARPGRATTADRPAAPSPWRDRGYLLFVLMDTPMNLDDSVLLVGLPLWLVNHTAAPHALVPAFLMINTVLIAVLQVRVSAKVEGARRAAQTVAVYGLTMLACCTVLAASAVAGVWAASAGLLAAAMLVTTAELMRSASSWELAVSLAPREARASYVGMAGISQSVQKSAGPPLLTGAVMALGPLGWLMLGPAITGLSIVQRRVCLRRLDAMHSHGSSRDPREPVLTSNPIGR
jgi:MFS family permease